jgi:hypothetical protein
MKPKPGLRNGSPFPRRRSPPASIIQRRQLPPYLPSLRRSCGPRLTHRFQIRRSKVFIQRPRAERLTAFGLQWVFDMALGMSPDQFSHVTPSRAHSQPATGHRSAILTMGVQATGSNAEGHQHATRTRPHGEPHGYAADGLAAISRRQTKQREGRPADPGPSERNSSIQSVEATAGSADHAKAPSPS